MSIKNLKPNDPRYNNGSFEPQYPQKYVGKFPIYYRSGWEYKFMIYCDKNQNIVQWSSESIQIPYMSPIDQKQHIYNVDFWVVMKTGDTYKKYLVEVKPSKSLIPPTPIKDRKQTQKRVSNYIYEAKQYALNTAKFKYADMYAKQTGCQFIVLTEKELFLI